MKQFQLHFPGVSKSKLCMKLYKFNVNTAMQNRAYFKEFLELHNPSPFPLPSFPYRPFPSSPSISLPHPCLPLEVDPVKFS